MPRNDLSIMPSARLVVGVFELQRGMLNAEFLGQAPLDGLLNLLQVIRTGTVYHDVGLERVTILVQRPHM